MQLTAQAFDRADMARNLTNTKIRAANAECNMALKFGPARGGSRSTRGCRAPRPQRPLSRGPIGLSGRRGEGHAVAVFCVEGPLRGRRSAQRGYGLDPISGIKFRKSGQPDRRSAGGSTKEDDNS